MKILLFAALLLAQTEGRKLDGQTRAPHPFAPSLPTLTDEEYQAQLNIIDRFIAQDTGKLQGKDAAKAIADFNSLGADAVFALIEGLNKAANMEDSCPAVFIGKKLKGIINSTRDLALLDFAKENIGAGVTAKRHQGLLTDMRFGVAMRKSVVARTMVAAKKPAPKEKSIEKSMKEMSVDELASAARLATGEEKKRKLYQEIAARKGEQPILIIGFAADKEEPAEKGPARAILVESLGRLSAEDLKLWLKKGPTSARMAAARMMGNKGYKLIDDLVAALADSEDDVRQAAREALVQLAGRAVDHGPALAADSADCALSQERWRLYWKNR